MAHVSRKLSGALQGALAGGGDPATSPLYVFGPFLQLIVAAGVARITFGASVWLAVLTVVTVGAMYRLVMSWVTDGSGGTGLNEEEFGPWAVKVSAAITIIEYTLTFLVSVAALVTFIADRAPALNDRFLGLPWRTYLASGLSVVVGVAVNRGPKVAARAFGPATGAILVLLWIMIGASIWKLGFRLPDFHLQAFAGKNVGITFGGYARILALMTGIEVFANLVAAYEGSARERSRKAFASLVIIMGTTSVTMLIVGPAIFDLANPLDDRVSVFTQTMDRLLPMPMAYAGTMIGVAVLLSAAAAASQGVQNLALGLRYRHYLPAALGQRNRFEVADKPVWLMVGVCVVCFVLFGTGEGTYLALYASGVFVLLTLTGWATIKRLGREMRAAPSSRAALSIVGALLAATLTSGATVIIFVERFFAGAWGYLVMVPALYLLFGRFRARLGEPSAVEDRLGLLLSASYLPPLTSQSIYAGVAFKHILVPLDQSPAAEQSLAMAETLSRAYDSILTLLTVVPAAAPEGPDPAPSGAVEETSVRDYLGDVAGQLRARGHRVAVEVRRGDPPEQIGELARNGTIDAVVMTTDGRSRLRRWLASSVTSEVIYQTTPPLLLVRPTDSWRSTRTRFARLLVALDGSEIAEQVLPYVHELAQRFRGEVLLLAVPEGSESDDYPEKMKGYLGHVADALAEQGIECRVIVTGSAPAQTIVGTAEAERADLIMMVSHGSGGVARQDYVRLGSVVDLVLQGAPCPMFLVSAVSPGQAGRPPDSSGAA